MMPSALISLVAILLHAEPQLGSPLRFSGYSVRPPLGFRMSRMEAFRETRAGAASSSPAAARELAAALVDGPGDDAASMLVSLVDGPFTASPGERDDFAAATVRHFAEELGMTLSLERVQLFTGGAPHVEVLGSLRQEGQVRRILFAAMQGSPRHAVLLFSVPSGRYESMIDGLRASLGSFRAEGPAAVGLSRGASGAAAGALAGALLVSLTLWRRNQKARRRAG
ncbi:MAG TPA: hypothetical protein VEY30_09400 [Myxococcaceae bacterium]|nr:hypothetical protein [Myxococcaceae bacterium]